MIYTLGERRADLAADSYVAPSAQLIGSVRLASESSVWFNVVIRGDCDWIEVGAGSNVQDGTVIHTDAGAPTRIGAGVTIGHMAFLHSCTIGDGSMIANGAMVLDRVQVGKQCLIAAGALLPPDKVIPDRSVVMGAPGKVVREVTERDLAMLARAAENYRQRTHQYRSELRIDPRWPPMSGATG
jgi:carbonic anhydrase/acetyltransferase-like protein (isoleucine patch superfamily)